MVLLPTMICTHIYYNYCSAKEIIKNCLKKAKCGRLTAEAWLWIGDSVETAEAALRWKIWSLSSTMVVSCSRCFICKMRTLGSLLGGLVRTWPRTQIAIVEEVTSCQRSSKNGMNISSILRVKCESSTRVHYPREMKCVLHAPRYPHTHRGVTVMW